MILSYIVNLIKYKKWKIIFGFTLFVFGLKFIPIISTLYPCVNQLLELHKCPVCYGVSFCSHIDKVNITLDNILFAFSYFLGIKNVFFGYFGGNKVVLKKLAHSSELNEFDRMLCDNKNLSRFCAKNTERNFDNNIDFYQLIVKRISVDFTKDNFSRLRLCPTTQRLNTFLHCVYLNNENIDRKTVDINIWTLVTLNPEPLLLQILSADEGWPVPKYLGACGRVVIEEYVGLPLSAYYHESWLIRAKIASSLLDIAYMFTFKSNDFGFYLTDISADNIAIDSHNTAKIVDLENVIVVDKNILPEERPTEWEQLQENVENVDCANCLAFSPVDICNHKFSDHNYYAICQSLLALDLRKSILPGGLLHDIPPNILQQHPNIKYLIEQCATPDRPKTRIYSGRRLKELLDTILENT